MDSAGLPRMSPVGTSVSLRRHPAATAFTTLDGSATASTSAAPAAAAPSPGGLSNTRARPSLLSRRSISASRDPHRVCRAQVDQLLELLSEQVELAQSIRAAVRLATLTGGNRSSDPTEASHDHQRVLSPVGTSRLALHNTENVPPTPHGRAQKALSSSSRSPGVHEHSLASTAVASLPPSPSPSAEVSVARLVDRLHVLHEETARFATSRCLPSLVELLATFDAYWTWKAAHDVPDGVDALTSQQQPDAGRHQHQHQRQPTSLRQRYEQVLRVRDELRSFLHLYADAVRAIDVHLSEWQHSRAALTVAANGEAEATHVRSSPSQHKDRHCEFESYMCQVVDVAQATRHVAQLLQAALRALCSPAPRTASDPESLQHDRLHRHDGVKAAVTTLSATATVEDDARMELKEADAAQQQPAFYPNASPHGRSVRSPATRTPSALPHHHEIEEDHGGSDAWADAVSPLTPPPPAAAAIATRTTAASPASPAPRPVERKEGGSVRCHDNRRSRPDHPAGSSGRGSTSPSRLAASPDTADLTMISLSPSRSTTAAVSVSPLTVQRRLPSPSSRDVREAHASLNALSSAPAPSDTTAAVSPVVGLTASGTQRSRWHHSLSNGVRSLLADLDSAGVGRSPTAALDSGTADVFVPPTQPQQQQQQQHHQQQEEPQLSSRSGEVQLAGRDVCASTSLSPSPSPSPPMPSQERRTPLLSASPLPTRTQAATERSGSATASSDGLGGDVSVGRAASVPTVLWPRLSHTGQGPPVLAEAPAAAKATAMTSLDSTFDLNSPSMGTTTATREVDADFYTSRAQPAASPATAHVWEKTFSPTPLELDELEAELGATQQRLQRETAASTSRRRLTRVAAAAPATAAADTVSLASLEVSLHDAVQTELKALRTEQKQTLHDMQKDIRQTLAEVVSAAASSVVASRSQSSYSRASSLARSEGTQTEDKEDEQYTTARHAKEEGSKQGGAAVSKTTMDTMAPPASLSPSSPAVFAPPPHVPPSSAALQDQLAATEARAARLEQQAVTLKKRLWVAETVGTAPERRRGSADGTGVPQRRRRALSLRDAFLYSQAGGADDADDRDEEDEEDAGVEAEEAAIAYLVDRQLGWHDATRSRSANGQRRGRDGRPRARTMLHSSQAPRARTTASHDSCGDAQREGPADTKCFDDDHDNDGSNDGRVGRALRHSLSTAAPTRSPLIRQKRASIFELLRQGPPAPAGSSTSTPSAVATTTATSTTALTPPPPLRPLPDTGPAEGVGRASASTSHAHTSAPHKVPTGPASAELHHHPYSTTTTTTATTATEGPGLAPASRVAPHTTSQYYAAISDHGNQRGRDGSGARGVPVSFTQPHVHRSVDDGSPSQTSAWSSLRAAQVLENARRLLRDRSAAIGAWQGADVHGCNDTRTWSAECWSEGAGRQPRGGERVRGHPAEAAAAAARPPPPGQWGEHVELHDGTSPLPRGGFQDVYDQERRASARQHPSSPHTRHDDGDGDDDNAALRAESIPSRGHYRDAQSVESVYHGYDTSPCAAVAYSTSKVPRSSSDPDTSRTSPPARRHREAVTPPRRRRVDSATSPITRTDACHNGSGDNIGESASSSSPSSSSSSVDEGRTESDEEGVRGRQRRHSRRKTSAAPRTDAASSPPTADTQHRQRSRRSPSPSPAALPAGGTDLLHATHQHHHRDDDDISKHYDSDGAAGRAVSLSRSASRRGASLTSSRSSAEQQLMDTLVEQASTLRTAQQQLQDQQRQLREKRAQVQQAVERAASARAPAPASTVGPRGRDGRGGLQEGVFSTAARRGQGKQFRRAGSSTHDDHEAPAAAELHRLLKRFAAAESTLAEREQRIRHALYAVQRQQDALVRDDLL